MLSVAKALWSIIVGNYGNAFEILKGYDRLGNASTNGRSNETISSRANRARSEGRRWGCVLCKILDSIDPNHCKNSENI